MRMLTVTVSSLIEDKFTDDGQISLFGDNKSNKKHEDIERTVDIIRGKFGRDAMKKGSLLNKDFRLRDKDK